MGRLLLKNYCGGFPRWSCAGSKRLARISVAVVRCVQRFAFGAVRSASGARQRWAGAVCSMSPAGHGPAPPLLTQTAPAHRCLSTGRRLITRFSAASVLRPPTVFLSTNLSGHQSAKAMGHKVVSCYRAEGQRWAGAVCVSKGGGPGSIGPGDMEQTAPAQRCLAPTVERTAHNAQRTPAKPKNLSGKSTGRSVPNSVASQPRLSPRPQRRLRTGW